jgi:hypothetical protein
MHGCTTVYLSKHITGDCPLHPMHPGKIFLLINVMSSYVGSFLDFMQLTSSRICSNCTQKPETSDRIN